MLKLFKHMKKIYWLVLFLIIALVVTQVLCDLSMPDYLQKILTEASYASSLRENNLLTDEILMNSKNEIIMSAVYMGLLALGSVSSTIIVCFLSAKFAANFSYGVRKAVYQKVSNFSLAEIDKFSTASLITRSTNDITQVQMVVNMVLRMAVAAPIYAIYGIVKVARIQAAAQLSVIVIVAIVALVLLVVSIFITVLPKFKMIQKLTDRLNLVTRENLTGLRVVRACDAEAEEENKFREANNNITKNNIFVNRVFSIFMPGMQIIMNYASLLILWIGAYIVLSFTSMKEQADMLGSVFTFQQCTMFIVMGFMQLTMIIVLVPRGIVSGNRINEILESKTAINDPYNVIKAKEVGTIEFKNVSFSYNETKENVLDNISFKINKGETLAIIGGTGSGKTSLVNLITRFYDASQGEVLVDNVNVKDYTQEELRDKIGLVPQKAVLFSGTIRTNLAFGKSDLTDDDIAWALDIAQASDFVKEIGYDANVAQGGANFSGGQKQRLCIARAVIKKPEIFIFDDSFSALDLKTDQKLREALANKTKGITNVIVAQRIGTILHADKIIVLDEGKVVGYGNHQELIKNCKVYQEIAYSQLSKEELENA